MQEARDDNEPRVAESPAGLEKALRGSLPTKAQADRKGIRGVVCCAGCQSTSGTLVGTEFKCNTSGCKYQRRPFNPYG